MKRVLRDLSCRGAFWRACRVRVCICLRFVWHAKQMRSVWRVKASYRHACAIVKAFCSPHGRRCLVRVATTLEGAGQVEKGCFSWQVQ